MNMFIQEIVIWPDLHVIADVIFFLHQLVLFSAVSLAFKQFTLLKKKPFLIFDTI